MKTDLTELRLDAFRAEHPNVDIGRHRYLGRWRYKLHFWGDVPRKSVSAFARAIGAEAAWHMHPIPSLFFDSLMIHTMARCVVDNLELRRVITEAQALQEDAAWESRSVYRVLFRSLCRPDPNELAARIEDPAATIVTEDQGLSRSVVAVLTSNDETMALLKLAYPAVHVEERCPYLRWAAAS